MWDAGMKMTTQFPSGQSRCFCGAEIDIRSVDAHIRSGAQSRAGCPMKEAARRGRAGYAGADEPAITGHIPLPRRRPIPR
jgi:hypothetical protein